MVVHSGVLGRGFDFELVHDFLLCKSVIGDVVIKTRISHIFWAFETRGLKGPRTSRTPPRVPPLPNKYKNQHYGFIIEILE